MADWKAADDLAGMIAQGEQHGLNTLHVNEDIRSVIEILMYGLKGMAAYMDHAMILGRSDDEVMAFFQKALAASTDPSLGLMDFVGLSMECGKHNLTVMGLLNTAHTDTYGHPVGDEVLRAVARTLVKEARNTDVVATPGTPEARLYSDFLRPRDWANWTPA